VRPATENGSGETGGERRGPGRGSRVDSRLMKKLLLLLVVGGLLALAAKKVRSV
jgi:hypothetical protein